MVETRWRGRRPRATASRDNSPRRPSASASRAWLASGSPRAMKVEWTLRAGGGPRQEVEVDAAGRRGLARVVVQHRPGLLDHLPNCHVAEARLSRGRQVTHAA